MGEAPQRGAYFRLSPALKRACPVPAFGQRAAIWRGVPEGWTAVYDAIEMALDQLDFASRDKKTLIVISDGGDNVSVHKLQDVMHDVLESVTTNYTIGIFDEDDPDKNPVVLNRIGFVSRKVE